MNNLKIILFLNILFLVKTNEVACATVPTATVVLNDESSVSEKKNKIDWKKVFRPIRIFKKKLSYWMLRFFGIALVLGLLGWLRDKTAEEGLQINSQAGLLTLLSIFIGSSLIVVILLIALPIIYIVRIFKELKWIKSRKKGTSKCYDF